jgi:hypothetical protein
MCQNTYVNSDFFIDKAFKISDTINQTHPVRRERNTYLPEQYGITSQNPPHVEAPFNCQLFVRKHARMTLQIYAHHLIYQSSSSVSIKPALQIKRQFDYEITADITQMATHRSPRVHCIL